MDFVNRPKSGAATKFYVRDYDLDVTLTSGQAFRWESIDGGWESVIAGRWVRLTSSDDGIEAEAAIPMEAWDWLSDYLQVQVDIRSIVETFPKDEAMTAAINSCFGLRLLRQDPWECLASFILSSTKQIVQIQQIVRFLCERYGQPIEAPQGTPSQFSFPTAETLSNCSEDELRACKMGFRAPYLKETASMVANGVIDLESLKHLPLDKAREGLLSFPGVGRKIADCVLLFAYGFPAAFPIDVWVIKALRELYFKNRSVKLEKLQRFAAKHFGPNAGYAQQYLFHYMRTQKG